MLLEKIANRLAVNLGIHIQNANNRIAQATLPKFGNRPNNVRIDLPRKIINPDRMVLGNDIWLGSNSLLIALSSYPGPSMRHPDRGQPTQSFDSRITIGNRVSSTGGLQLAAHNEITIEDDVLFASNINITDGLHGFEHANEPYKYQKIFNIAPILVKRGCWIGQNVVILPGVTIGELSIIGANSVVTKSIPERCVAAGNPAGVIKRWDDSIRKWVSVRTAGRQDQA